MDDRPLATLVIAEHDNQSLAVGTRCAIKAAFDIKDDAKSLPISVLLIGYQCQSVLDELKCVKGVAEIIWVDAKEYEHGLAENIAPLISQVAKNYSHILSPASTFGKNVMPRVAALLDVGQLSDVMTIESIDTVIRPIYAGNALATVTSNDPFKVMTIRSTAFDALEMGVGGTFDVVAGKVKRAPQWMQKAGLEWLYRVIQEPGRMWKRYLITNSKFAYLLIKNKFGS